MKYGIIFLSALIIEICSTFYIRYVSEANTLGMLCERIKMAFSLAFGYVTGVIVVINLIK